jgi:diguanylate cyclase (GGDEF)-like protein/PAS domain S-box-containing protein
MKSPEPVCSKDRLLNFDILTRSSWDPIILSDHHMRIVAWSPTAESSFLWTCSEVRDRPLESIISVSNRPEFNIAVSKLLSETESANPSSFNINGLRKDGTEFPLEINLDLFINNGATFLIMVAHDVSERLWAAEAIRESETKFSAIFNASPDYVFMTDTSGRITEANPAFLLKTGLTLEQSRHHKINEYFAGNNEEAVKNALLRLRDGQRIMGFRIKARTPSDEVLDLELQSMPVKEQGRVSYFINIARDVTESNWIEEQLSYMASHDPLTGLANRMAFERALNRAVNNGRRGTSSALIFLDMDKFKEVNDTLGHSGGDKALSTMAQFIQQHIRNTDFAARLGGDEFAVILNGTPMDQAMVIAERLRKTLTEYSFHVQGEDIHLAASIGLTCISGQENAKMVLSQADEAMYRAKAAGRNNVVYYEPLKGTDGRPLTPIDELLTQIREAFKRNLFEVHFQPVVRLSNRKVEFYEALVRLRLSETETVMPDDFLPTAKRFGLMPQVTRWVAQEVSQALIRNTDIRCFINISNYCLADNSLLDFIESLVKQHGLENGRLGFEITDAIMIDAEYMNLAQRWINRLKPLGCPFALDDFSEVGHSFVALRDLPVNLIKLGHSLVTTLPTDPVERAMVQALQTLASALGKEIVAEYVENEAIAGILQEMGVTYGQGFHLGRPQNVFKS